MRRNTYDMERASAAVVRKAQQAPRPRRTKAATVPSPEQSAVHECNEEIKAMRRRGERVPTELHQRYSALLKQYHDTLK